MLHLPMNTIASASPVPFRVKTMITPTLGTSTRSEGLCGKGDPPPNLKAQPVKTQSPWERLDWQD